MFTFLIVLGSGNVIAQQWVENLPQEQIIPGETGFYEMQKAFNDYWGAKNVENGYYEKDGQRVKAGGWKQFKRWEWFWESRVDPQTGEFPSTSAFYENQRYQEENPQLKSGSASGNWTTMGPSNTNGGYAGLGRLNCVTFHPNDNNIFYVGAAAGGVWKSSNGGGSWNPLSDNTAVLGVSDIIVLANGGTETIYLATGDRDAGDNYSVGVLKSTNGGVSWNTTGLDWSQSSGQLISRLLVDPNDSDILYAATTSGLYKTTDAGNSWTKKYSANFIDIQFKPDNSAVIYGSTKYGGDIYRSTNSGSTWSRVLSTSGTRAEIAVSPDNPDYVYSIISNYSNGLYGIYKSVDGGSSFTKMTDTNSPNMLGWNCDGSDSGGQGWYDLCIAVDPTDADRVVVGGVNSWISSNGGSDWALLNHWSSTCGGKVRVIHADKHDLVFQGGTSVLFECNDGGLYSLSSDGSYWDHYGNGLVISQLYRLGVSQTKASDVIAGLQDNGTKVRYGTTWYDVIGGDGMECAIDPTDINIQYGELYYGQIRRTRNLWGNYVTITGNITGTPAWVTPFILDPSDPSVIYVGFQDVWKRDFDNDTGFAKISSFNSSASLRSLVVAPSNPDVICAATGGTSGRIYRTTDGGGNWFALNPPSTSTINYMTIHATNPDIMWVAFGQFNSDGVYRTTDGGNSWTNISNGLPSIPVNCVIQNHNNTTNTELYAGTDVGVYIKYNDSDWVPFSSGLPNVVVSELEIYYSGSSSKLRAATYGRGLWESDLYDASSATSLPVCNFAANETTIEKGNDVQFTDLSTNNPSSWSWTFPGGQPSSSAQQHPLVTYPNAGEYDVYLTVTNQYGEDSETFVAYILVEEPEIAFSENPFSAQDATQDVAYTVSIANSVNHPEIETLVFSKTSGPSWLSVAENGDLTGTPVQGDNGLNSFGVHVVDGSGGSDDAVLNIDVLEVNDPPVFTDAVITRPDGASDASYSGTLDGEATNNDGDEISYSKTGGPAWLVIAADGSLSGTPSASDLGLNTWTVEASDGTDVDNAALHINVVQTLVYCTPENWKANYEWIESVEFGGSEFVTDNNGGYFDNSASTIQVDGNSEVSFTLDPGYKYWSFSEYWKIWIDYNQDGEFDNVNELVYSSGKSRRTVSGSFTVVNVPGTTKMRISMSDRKGAYPCSNSRYGEVEDYSVEINSTSSTPLVADFVADRTTVNVGSTVYFTDLTSNDPTAWLWEFGDGQSSTAQHPVVTFNNPGTFGVTLTASNFFGSDLKTVTGYIVVSDAAIQPVADFVASRTVVSTGDIIQLTDLSANSPTSYAWYISNGVQFSQANPEISFTESGIYDISLTVTNSAGQDEILRTEYIMVSDAGPGQGAEYVEPTGVDNESNFISSVEIGEFSKVSDKGISGYVHYENPVFDLTSNQRYNIRLTPSSSRTRYYWRIWVDLNMDGDFADAGETVYSSNNKRGIRSEEIIIPDGYSGLTRIRVAMKKRGAPLPDEDDFIGEVEDYDLDLETGLFVGVDDIKDEIDDLELKVNVFPNPVTDILNVKTETLPEESTIRILNLVGQELLWQKVESDNTQLDVNTFEKGIYFLILEHQEQRVVKKFVKN